MKLNSLQALTGIKQLKALPSIKRMTYARVKANRGVLNEIEVILYSSNICLYAMRILRGEIHVKNREAVLNRTMAEIAKLESLLSKKDFYQYSTYTEGTTKEFYKSVGLKPEHVAI